ncbi:OPT family oligopeptide transporter [Nonomuraea sp. ATR24]|uniref:OPT family oligopeptide transporter n=1 Tax=Nonomuraea TaxID=83681 RepID=UPI001C5F00E3|nr:oligopeptide transporter, OPT family [Nonomuraea ceibae]
MRVKELGERSELSVRSVGIGFAVGFVMTAAITYLALYSGLAISAAIPAALICTGLIRVRAKRATVLENNLAQTIASSGEALAVGVAFTLPALVLAGVRQDLDYWEVSLAAALGGLLGVLFMIPLRRSLTVESPELTYPESVAAAKIAEAGEDGRGTLLPAGLAVLAGAVFKVLSSVVQVISGTVEGAVAIGGRVFYGGMDISLALVGVGLIVKLRFTVMIVAGGVLSWLVAIPLLADVPAAGGSLVTLAWDTWASHIRYLGIGAMIVGGCWSIVQARTSIARGARTAFAGLRPGRRAATERTDTDLGMRWVVGGVALAGLGIFAFVWSMVGSVALAALSAVVAVVLVFFFSAVSGYVVGFVGNSNNPISGLAICGFLAASLIFTLLRAGADSRVVLCVLLIAVFVCTATATAGDTAQHVKTGAILGGTPRRVQLAQLFGVGVFAFVVAPIVVLLLAGYGIGGEGSDTLKAPQAVIFANLADAVFTRGSVPMGMLWTGAGIGVALIVLDQVLRRVTGGAVIYVMPIAIGIYLPLSLSLPLLVGGLLAHALERAGRRSGEPGAEDVAHDRAVLVCSGLITGEALVGLSAALPRSMGWDLPIRVLDNPFVSLAALGLVLAALFWYANAARNRNAAHSDRSSP